MLAIDTVQCNGDSRRALGFRGKDGGFHPTLGKATILNPDGSVAWENDWEINTLVDQGEQSVLNVYFLEAANPTKYLMLLNQSDPAETDTVANLTESNVTGVAGYNRVQMVNTDWGTPTLTGGDYKTTASAKTFGPASASSWTVTHVALVTTSTGLTSPTTLFLLWISLGGSTTVNIGQQFQFTAAVTAQ